MKMVFRLALLFNMLLLQAQYQFTGQVSKVHANSPVYLSLVEDYRKTSRVYLDQIFQKTMADSLGYFSFSGDNIPIKNTIFRIHSDGCREEQLGKNHFLRQCPLTESILFIAKNTDTLHLPMAANQQAFCQIVSTNAKSDGLLRVDALKEEMIVAILDGDTDLAQALTLKKWFGKLQGFGIRYGEPLVELYTYDLLSDRKSETHEYYLENINGNSGYYLGLAQRLRAAYPGAAFTTQYANEVRADMALLDFGAKTTSNVMPYYLLGILSIFVLVYIGHKHKRRRKKTELEALLTVQERKVVNAMLQEKSNKEIAENLHISLSTVKTHINSIYKKLDVASRSGLRSKL